MVQFSQTSWQEFSLPNVLETLQYAPLNLTIGKSPLLHYIFPKELAAGATIKYQLQFGFRVIRWTGIISSVKILLATTPNKNRYIYRQSRYYL